MKTVEEDAKLFGVWIREASERPGRLAQAISGCITPDDYRTVLRAFLIATELESDFHAPTTGEHR